METVAAADCCWRFKRRIRISVSTHFWKHGLYSKVASLDPKSSAGLIQPPLDRPLFPFSPTSTLSPPLFTVFHFSPSLPLSPFLSFCLSLSLLLSPSLIPPPSVGSCSCAHVADESICGGSARAHTHTHAHAHILSPTKASVSVWLSVRCSTNRGERNRNITRDAREKKEGYERERESRIKF